MVCRRDVGWFHPELPPTTSEPNRGIGSANVKRALHCAHCGPDMFRPIAVPGHDTLSRDIMRTVRYGILPALHRDSQNFTLKSLAAQCTVQCALKVVVTREESSEAMAE